MEFGRSSVDTILAGQFGGRRPQLLGYRTLSLPVLPPFLEASTYVVDCESPASTTHAIPPHRCTRRKERRYQLCPAEFTQAYRKLTTLCGAGTGTVGPV